MIGFSRLIGCCCVALMAASCATGQRFTQVNPSMTPGNPELGRIFFYRPSSFGAAIRPDVKLNDERVGAAVSWGFFYVDRPPGNYQVVTSTEVDRKLSFVLEKAQTRFVRFSVSFGFFVGHVYGELVDQEIGRLEIADCNYTGNPLSAQTASP